VKIWLLVDGKKTEKRKTPVSERTLNPTYNELFTAYNLQAARVYAKPPCARGS